MRFGVRARTCSISDSASQLGPLVFRFSVPTRTSSHFVSNYSAPFEKDQRLCLVRLVYTILHNTKLQEKLADNADSHFHECSFQIRRYTIHANANVLHQLLAIIRSYDYAHRLPMILIKTHIDHRLGWIPTFSDGTHTYLSHKLLLSPLSSLL